jgi:hypothetical protein
MIQTSDSERCLLRAPAALAIALSVSTFAHAQPAPVNAPDSPRQQVIRRFEERSPAVGQPLPDIAGVDADGQPLRLSSLKGSHVVLVFGCLT